jgi:hypothetical protein
MNVFGAKISYAGAEILFILGNMATTNKHCIVIERFIVWIHPTLTRYGIEHLLPKRLEIFEPSVRLCAVCKHFVVSRIIGAKRISRHSETISSRSYGASRASYDPRRAL